MVVTLAPFSVSVVARVVAEIFEAMARTLGRPSRSVRIKTMPVVRRSRLQRHCNWVAGVEPNPVTADICFEGVLFIVVHIESPFYVQLPVMGVLKCLRSR